MQYRRPEFNPWVRKLPWRREWQPTSVFVPGEFHGQRTLAGYSPRGCKESDLTEQRAHERSIVSKMCALNLTSFPSSCVWFTITVSFLHAFITADHYGIRQSSGVSFTMCSQSFLFSACLYFWVNEKSPN